MNAEQLAQLEPHLLVGLAAWSLLSIHRLVAWEVPILGWRFAALRYGACVVLPVAAGLLARVFTRV